MTSPDLSDAGHDIDSVTVDTEPVAIGDAVIPLLRGVVYATTHRRAWQVLQRYPSAVQDYVSALHLDVHVDAVEGFAFLRRKRGIDDGAPSLLRRSALSYRLSLLIALLRRRLTELDAQGDQRRLILTRDELVDLVRTFHPERGNETKLHKAVDADANWLVEMGFCRRTRGSAAGDLEVLRVLKAFVDAEWLADLAERLDAYAEYGVTDLEADDGD